MILPFYRNLHLFLAISDFILCQNIRLTLFVFEILKFFIWFTIIHFANFLTTTIALRPSDTFREPSAGVYVVTPAYLGTLLHYFTFTYALEFYLLKWMLLKGLQLVKHLNRIFNPLNLVSPSIRPHMPIRQATLAACCV